MITIPQANAAIIENGEDAVKLGTEILGVISKDWGVTYEDMLNTLSAYYLDTRCNAAAAAELLFVHKNTIQYRVRKFQECLADRLSDALEVNELCTALAVHRILQKNKEEK